jgi:hypothetical protein
VACVLLVLSLLLVAHHSPVTSTDDECAATDDALRTQVAHLKSEAEAEKKSRGLIPEQRGAETPRPGRISHRGSSSVPRW